MERERTIHKDPAGNRTRDLPITFSLQSLHQVVPAYIEPSHQCKKGWNTYVHFLCITQAFVVVVVVVVVVFSILGQKIFPHHKIEIPMKHLQENRVSKSHTQLWLVADPSTLWVRPGS